MIQKTIAKILREEGFDVNIEGDEIIASKKSQTAIISFLLKGKLPLLPKEVKDSKAIRVVIPLYEMDVKEEESIKRNGVIIWRRGKVEDTLVEVLTKKQKFSQSIFKDLLCPNPEVSPSKEEKMEGIVKAIINEEDVREIGKKTVEGFAYTLELVPYLVYRFHCEMALE